MGCPATLMMNSRVYTCDWPGLDHRGHAHYNHEACASWTTTEDDDLVSALAAARNEIERKVADIEAMRALAGHRRAVIELVYPMQRLMRTILDADHTDLDGLITALEGVS